MTDTGPEPVTPEPVSPEGDTVGQRIDAAVELVRGELNAMIDALQVRVNELSMRIDTLQGQVVQSQVQ